jgi:hypothetical protein
MSDDFTPPDLSEEDQKRLALSMFLDLWDEALDRGVQPEVLATTAIFAALTDMVDLYGEEAVADMLAELPERVRTGEFTPSDDVVKQ